MFRKKSNNILLVSFLIVVILVMLLVNVQYQIFPLHLNISHEKPDIRVLTFNIHSLGRNFEGRKIAQLILDEDADIVLLNEYNDTTSHEVDSLLKKRYTYTRMPNPKSKCSDVLYSKYPIDEFLKLSNKELRSSTYKSVISFHGKHLRLFCCHLASNNHKLDSLQVDDADSPIGKWEEHKIKYDSAQVQRIKEIERICTHLDSMPHVPTLVFGDMNDIACTPTLQPLLDRGYQDAWWKAGFGYGATYKHGIVRLRIDHIMFSQALKAINAKVIDSKQLSDHNALVAEFKIE